jgi:hypothetical protein
MRFHVRVTGSTPIPASSSATTPSSGSLSLGPKMTRVMVSAPKKLSRAKPNGYSMVVPLASSKISLPSTRTPDHSGSRTICHPRHDDALLRARTAGGRSTVLHLSELSAA